MVAKLDRASCVELHKEGTERGFGDVPEIADMIRSHTGSDVVSDMVGGHISAWKKLSELLGIT